MIRMLGMAAVAVGLDRGLTPSEVVSALATLVPAEKRGQVLQVGNITVINDCYNSNPRALDSMVEPYQFTVIDAGQPVAKIYRELQRSISRLQLSKVRARKVNR